MSTELLLQNDCTEQFVAEMFAYLARSTEPRYHGHTRVIAFDVDLLRYLAIDNTNFAF